MIFSERLQEIRLTSKLTQKQLAKALNVDYQSYQKYEYGKVLPGFEILIKLADFYNVSLDYLVGRSETPVD